MWTLLKTCWVRLNSQCLQKVQFNPTKTAFINALWNKPSYSLKITPSLETPFKPLFFKFLSTFQVQWNLDPTVPHKISLFKWAFPDLFFVFSIQLIENKWFLEIRRWLDSNLGPLVSEATALPAEPQQLPIKIKVLWVPIFSFVIRLQIVFRISIEATSVLVRWVLFGVNDEGSLVARY